MPKFRITSPDGQTYEITAPEGATQEQVLAYAQQHAAAPKQSPADHYADLQKQAAAGPQSDPTSGNFAQNALEGFGKSGVDTFRGVKQLLGGSSQQEVDEQRRLDAPLMATGGGFVGNVTGQAAQMAVPVPAGLAVKGASILGRAAPVIGAAARAGAFSATQGVGTGETRAGNTGIGAALGVAGHGIAQGASRLGKGAMDKIAPEVLDLYRKAQAAGIPVHFSQLSDSKFVKTLASTLGYLPFTGAGAKQAAQQAAFNKAATRGFGVGIEAPNISDDVVTAAKGEFNKAYDGIFNGRNIALDRQAVADLFKLHQTVGDDLEASQAAVARKQIEKILDHAGQNGSMPGQLYQSLRSKLRTDFGKESSLGKKVMEARKILDDAAKRSLGPQDAAKLDRTNAGYANFQTVRDALKQVAGAGGNVKPSALWNLIKNGSTKEMRELAKIGQVLLKEQIPDSGTAGRLLATGGLGTAGMAGGMAAATPLLKLLALGATVGRAANSDAAARYLANGSKPLAGLARLVKPAPVVLPALARAGTVDAIPIIGGTRGTPEQIAADAEVVRRFRQKQQQGR